MWVTARGRWCLGVRSFFGVVLSDVDREVFSALAARCLQRGGEMG